MKRDCPHQLLFLDPGKKIIRRKRNALSPTKWNDLEARLLRYMGGDLYTEEGHPVVNHPVADQEKLLEAVNAGGWLAKCGLVMHPANFKLVHLQLMVRQMGGELDGTNVVMPKDHPYLERTKR